MSKRIEPHASSTGSARVPSAESAMPARKGSGVRQSSQMNGSSRQRRSGR